MSAGASRRNERAPLILGTVGCLVLVTWVLVLALGGSESEGGPQPPPPPPGPLPVTTYGADGQASTLAVRAPDDIERSGGAEVCAVVRVPPDGEVAADCSTRVLNGVASAALYYDCERDRAVLFGRVTRRAVDLRVTPWPQPGLRLGTTRRFEDLGFVQPLSIDDLPATVTVIGRRGERLQRLNLLPVCAGGAASGVLPVSPG